MPPRKLIAPPGKQRIGGFSLIEAIVAMVLLATLGGALFIWINTNLQSVTRIRDANQQQEIQANVLAYLNTVNPMETPEGNFENEDYILAWNSTPITPKQAGISYMYGQSLFDLMLYEISVQILRKNHDPWFDFKVKQVGYKQTRALTKPFETKQ